MFLIDFLEKLQDKPKHVRQQILWVAVFVCMLAIFIFWVYSLKFSLRDSAKEAAKIDLISNEAIDSAKKMQEEWQATKKEIKSNLPSVFEGQENQENPFSQ